VKVQKNAGNEKNLSEEKQQECPPVLLKQNRIIGQKKRRKTNTNEIRTFVQQQRKTLMMLIAEASIAVAQRTIYKNPFSSSSSPHPLDHLTWNEDRCRSIVDLMVRNT
jgi:hypothetical protein